MGHATNKASAASAHKQTVGTLLAAFLQQYAGKPRVGDTPVNRGQCVGLVEVWGGSLGMPHTWGNAKDLLDYAPIPPWRKFGNLPTNYPEPGDIVVWGDTWGGGYGHTGIVVTAGVMYLTVFQQNDPDGSAPHLKLYTYDGVIGWLRPEVGQ